MELPDNFTAGLTAEPFKWDEQRSQAAIALALGKTKDEVASEAECTRKTVYNWLSHPDFAAEVDRLSPEVRIIGKLERRRAQVISLAKYAAESERLRAIPLPAGADVRGRSKLYLLWAEGSSFYKIGVTSVSVRKRLSELQVGCPLPLHFVAAAYGTVEDERRLHSKLRRFRTSGEWFDFYGAVDEFRNLLLLFNIRLPLEMRVPCLEN